MIDDLNPYPEYKESGQEWLGTVPAHWEVRRAKFLLRETDARSTTGKEQLLRVSQYTGVTERKSLNGSDSPDTRAASLRGYKIVRKSDLVINIMLAWNGSLGVSSFDGIVSPAYCVYRLNPELNPWYFHELLRIPGYKGRIKTASTGVVESRLRLYSDDLGCIESLLPPPAEQAAVVRFLDHWNGRLEKAIRAKRRVIALLHEQKQAVIHRTVTGGLDSNVKLKDSGIPWLGEIPEHWDVFRLSFLADFSNGKAHEQFFDPNGEYVCVNARFVSTGGGAVKYCTKNFCPARRGEVLMVMSDLPNGRALARAYLVNDDRKYAVNQRVCVLRSKQIEPGFLAYAANRNYGLLRHDDGSNQTHLSNGDYKSLPVQCPPLEEQKAIVQTLDKHVAEVNIRIEFLEREIALLREYRTRLTADVVTGKLDVRAAAAKLPDLDEDPSPDAEVPEEEAELEEVEV